MLQKIVHPKIQFLSLFIHSYVIANLYAVIYLVFFLWNTKGEILKNFSFFAQLKKESYTDLQ